MESLVLLLKESDFFKLAILPLLIFLAKVTDVSLATLGLIFTARGQKKLSMLISFLEISIYLLAISVILENISEPHYFLAYALGYAVGTYTGMWLEERLAIGFFNLRLITHKNPERWLKKLRKHGFKPTCYRANAGKNRVHVIQLIIRRREMEAIRELIQRFDRKAFYSIEDIREAGHLKLGA